MSLLLRNDISLLLLLLIIFLDFILRYLWHGNNNGISKHFASLAISGIRNHAGKTGIVNEESHEILMNDLPSPVKLNISMDYFMDTQYSIITELIEEKAEDSKRSYTFDFSKWFLLQMTNI